jgi:hopene-associated glycosyltransferase HpnB
MSGTLILALASLAAWGGLVFGRAFFWRIERPSPVPDPARWPDVVAVIPARDEAEGIGRTVVSLLGQDYPGTLSVVVTDDQSRDGTADIARDAARAVGGGDRLAVISGAPLPPGWTGKVWAMEQGMRHADLWAAGADYVLFTDADIRHAPGQLRALVARAEAGRLDLASLMVRLHCVTLPERTLIPAFVYFFRMLYPFRRINDPASRVAGAAGGVMLARRSALSAIGGLAALKGALIDDCTLAARIKERGGRLWLALADETESLRVYRGWGEPWAMVARSAYDQLGHSPAMLAGTVLGMGLVFVAPPVLAVAGGGWAAGAGALAWAAMAATYLPMLRFYRRSPLWAPLLPAVAAIYLGATLHSAWRHHRGRGGQWKGRIEGGRTGIEGGMG